MPRSWLLALSLSPLAACVLFRPANKVMIPERAPPPAAKGGEAAGAFHKLKATDPHALRDDEDDPLVPPDGEVIGWYLVGGNWEPGRNAAGVLVERYAKTCLEWKHQGKCYWTWQNIVEPHMGGGHYGAPRWVTMARTREILSFPCP